jgi:uncharacterized protein YbjT (DUF2867 family)
MKVLIFGATGTVGRGVLLECLRDSEVELVVTWAAPQPAFAMASCVRLCTTIF